jgi:hypothetical protein
MLLKLNRNQKIVLAIGIIALIITRSDYSKILYTGGRRKGI